MHISVQPPFISSSFLLLSDSHFDFSGHTVFYGWVSVCLSLSLPQTCGRESLKLKSLWLNQDSRKIHPHYFILTPGLSYDRVLYWLFDRFTSFCLVTWSFIHAAKVELPKWVYIKTVRLYVFCVFKKRPQYQRKLLFFFC